MQSKCFVATLLVVCILVMVSCSFLSSSGNKSDFLYGEGFSNRSNMEQLAKSAATGNSMQDVAGQIVKRYYRYREVFISESLLPKESKAVSQFDSILKEVSPKPGVVNISIKDIEKVKQDVMKNAGIFNVKAISRIHIGSADKTLLEKIEENNELAAEFKKTQLYGKMIKRVQKYEKYISEKK